MVDKSIEDQIKEMYDKVNAPKSMEAATKQIADEIQPMIDVGVDVADRLIPKIALLCARMVKAFENSGFTHEEAMRLMIDAKDGLTKSAKNMVKQNDKTKQRKPQA